MDVASSSCHVDWYLNVYNLCHAICSLLTPIRQNKFFFLIRFLLVHGSGENRKSKYTGSVSPLFCSSYPFLINMASEYELAMNREFLFACFLYSLCPGGNSLESIKPLKDQSYEDPLVSTDCSQITSTNH